VELAPAVGNLDVAPEPIVSSVITDAPTVSFALSVKSFSSRFAARSRET
jgi:hypothetical protein